MYNYPELVSEVTDSLSSDEITRTDGKQNLHLITY